MTSIVVINRVFKLYTVISRNGHRNDDREPMSTATSYVNAVIIVDNVGNVDELW